MLKSLALAASLALTPLAAISAPWTLDKSHTQITFSVNHLGFSDTNGTFRDFDATISFDPENIEASEVTFTIKAESIDTFWAARDEHLRKADFLNASEHPEITFVSTGFESTGEDTATVTGDLTILGVTKPASFAAKLNKMGPNPFNPDVAVAGFTLTGEIDRTAYGMGYGAPAIGTIIPVTINLEMSPAS